MKIKLTLVLSLIAIISIGQTTKKNIAIVGGGISGIATAHEILKLDPTANITIFEKREVLGGNARTIATKNLFGVEVNVDMGPQYFTILDSKEVGPWDNYVQLLKDYNLYNKDKVSSFIGTIVVNNNVDEKPDFVSPKDGSWRGQSLGGLLNFFKLFRRSKQIYWGERDDYEDRIFDWVEAMPVKDSFKIKVAYPFLAASLGTSVANIKEADTKEMSKITAFGRDEFMVLDEGMGSMIQQMGKALQDKGVNIQFSSEVLSIHEHDGMSALVLTNDEELTFDHVVLAVHADHALKMLSNSSNYQTITESLDDFDYFKAHIVLHSDTSFVNMEKESFMNIRTDKKDYTLTSSTMNLSQVNKKYAGLYKSWLSEADYKKVKSNGTFIHEETFWHPMLPAKIMEMLSYLKKEIDTHDGLHIAGGWTEGLETQETAVKSAKRVALEIYQK
jgi:predicted NAD/FAD-binding protein